MWNWVCSISIFERSVLDQFAIEPTVVRVVDLFGHQSVEHWADFVTGFGQVKRDRCLGLDRDGASGDSEGNERAKTGRHMSASYLGNTHTDRNELNGLG